MARKRTNGSRLYTKRGRFYADLRDLGGKLEALKAPGERTATEDPDVATALLADRIKQLEAEKRGLAILGRGKDARLGTYAAHHLEEKAKAGRVTEGTIATAEMHLRRAVEFFGAGKPLGGITVHDVSAWRDHLASLPSGRNGRETLSPGTIRHALNDLSNLFRRAQGEGHVMAGFNPVAAMMDKPQASREEARWLEPHEAALVLEAAKTYAPQREDRAGPVYPLMATLLLTGGRWSEVAGLAVADVSFERVAVTFRPHEWRGLKTRGSHRSVPLWPQLEEILRTYLDGPDAPKGSLLFPSANPRALGHEDERMVKDLRKPLDAIAERAGWQAGEIRAHMLRHTYCAARLQTLDGGAPVSPYTVGRELGHGGRSMVDRVYGHLGELRHRSEVVEFRPAIIERISNGKVRRSFERRLRVVRGEAA